MGTSEAIYFWIGLTAYVAASLVALHSVCFRGNRLDRHLFRLAFVGFALHTAAIASRWMQTGHPPIMRTFENTLAGAWAILLTLFYLRKILPGTALPAAILLPFACLMLGFGVMNAPILEPLTPAYKTPWFLVHVTFAWFAYSSFAAAFALGAAYLLKERRKGRRLEKPSALDRLPDLDRLDDLCGRFVAFGFITDGVMLAAGSIWASKLWGKYWSWDPIEVWSLISFLVYGIYLHLRHAFGWRGKTMAAIAVAALITVIVSFWGVSFTMGTLHDFKLM